MTRNEQESLFAYNADVFLLIDCSGLNRCDYWKLEKPVHHRHRLFSIYIFQWTLNECYNCVLFYYYFLQDLNTIHSLSLGNQAGHSDLYSQIDLKTIAFVFQFFSYKRHFIIAAFRVTGRKQYTLSYKAPVTS